MDISSLRRYYIVHLYSPHINASSNKFLAFVGISHVLRNYVGGIEELEFRKTCGRPGEPLLGWLMLREFLLLSTTERGIQ